MLYRCVILQDDSNPSKVIDEVITYRWEDIPQAIVDKEREEFPFVVYKGESTEEGSIRWREVGFYKLKD